MDLKELRAQALRDRAEYRPEEGEVVMQAPKGNEGGLWLNLDELSSSEEDGDDEFEAPKRVDPRSRAELIQELQLLILEKERAKRIKQNPALLQSRLSAQESLLQQLDAECTGLENERIALAKSIDRAPESLRNARDRVARLQNELSKSWFTRGLNCITSNA